jgi:hypothetical protein
MNADDASRRERERAGEQAMERAVERALQQAMEAEAARVEIQPDALGQIRRRIRRRSRWASWRVALGGGAVAAIAGGAAAAVLVAGPASPPDAAPSPPGVSAPAPSPVTPSRSATPLPVDPTVGPSRPGGTGDDVSLAVYYVGVDRLTAEGGGEIERPRLYREFARLPGGDGSVGARTRAAVSAMLGRPPADRDYASAWPAGAGVRDARVAAGTVTVDLSGAASAVAEDLGADRARVAVQQLVWTATAASGVPAVRLLLDGRPAGPLFGHVPAAGPLRRAPLVDVVAPVWLIGPQDDAVVGRRVSVHVAGFVFEATARLRVRRGAEVVLDRSLTLSAGAPAQGEARVTVTLSPGTYVFEAFEASAVDGSVQHLDDHTVTVR